MATINLNASHSLAQIGGLDLGGGDACSCAGLLRQILAEPQGTRLLHFHNALALPHLGRLIFLAIVQDDNLLVDRVQLQFVLDGLLHRLGLLLHLHVAIGWERLIN